MSRKQKKKQKKNDAELQKQYLATSKRIDRMPLPENVRTELQILHAQRFYQDHHKPNVNLTF